MVYSNKKKLDQTLLDLFTNGMAVNFNVLCTLMEDRIVGNLGGRSIITVDRGRLCYREIEIMHELCQSLYFTNSLSQGSVFCFTRTTRHCGMFLRSPSDESIT